MIIRNPMPRSEFAAAIQAVKIEDSAESRRHFKVLLRRLMRGSIASSGQPAVQYTGFHCDSVLFGPDRCLVDTRDMLAGSPTIDQVIVLYVCDYSRKLAKRAFVRDGVNVGSVRVLDSFETFIEKDASAGAREMVAMNPGGW